VKHLLRNGNTYFNLKAKNHLVILSSQSYSSESGAKAGIKYVMKNDVGAVLTNKLILYCKYSPICYFYVYIFNPKVNNMKPQQKHLIREQLEKTVGQLACMRHVQRPVKGWLRSVREALGMSGKQFASRLGVSPPRITALEKSEQSGSATINTMRQAAEALDCVFVCAVIPRENLSITIRNQAESLARSRMNRVSHSMLLEAQQLSDSELQKVFAAEVENIMRTMPKELWDKPDEL
jgi:predicted DNA-binding mobile mystery protein A